MGDSVSVRDGFITLCLGCVDRTKEAARTPQRRTMMSSAVKGRYDGLSGESKSVIPGCKSHWVGCITLLSGPPCFSVNYQGRSLADRYCDR